MKEIIFPRKTIVIGECLAIVCTKIGKDILAQLGEPITHRRSWIRYEDENWRANRLSFHLNVKKIPCTPINRKEGFILHTCDHDWCVEPSHLYEGTQKQNMMDMCARHPTIGISRSENMMGNKIAKQENTLEELKPWEALNMSRSTWYRYGDKSYKLKGSKC